MTTAAPTASVVRRPVALPTSTTISATAVSSTGIVNPTDPNTATGISTIATSTVSTRSEEHTSELQSRFDLVCRLLLEKKNRTRDTISTSYCKYHSVIYYISIFLLHPRCDH